MAVHRTLRKSEGAGRAKSGRWGEVAPHPTARSNLNLVRALFDQTQPLGKAERLSLATAGRQLGAGRTTLPAPGPTPTCTRCHRPMGVS